jgi:HK97 family phage major capsid protein
MRPDIQRPFAVPKKKLEPIDFLVRSVSAIAMTASRRESLQQVFSSTYGTDEATALVLRAATAPALTTTTGWAAELVETVNAAFMDRLLKDSIYGPLSAKGSRFTFGRAGYIKIPSRTATSKLAGAWVGEAAAKPVKQASFTSVTLNPYKLAVISLFSEELGEHSTPAIEAIIRQAMSDDTSEALDGFLIDNVVGSATRPAGLLYNLSTLTPSAATDKTAAMIADVKALRQSIITAGGGRSIVLLMNSEQAMGIDLATTTNGLLFGSVSEGARRFGIDVIVSNTVPADTVIAVNAEDFASATGDVPRYSISDQATVHMEDTSPLPIATGAQGSGVLATPTRSLWQTDTIGVRMTWPVCWAMRRTGMVAFTSGVTW